MEVILKELREDGILLLTINREESYNALNIQVVSEMDAIMDEVYADDKIKSVILTGKGEKAFADGAWLVMMLYADLFDLRFHTMGFV